jgi:hypothetical protein
VDEQFPCRSPDHGHAPVLLGRSVVVLYSPRGNCVKTEHVSLQQWNTAGTWDKKNAAVSSGIFSVRQAVA